MDLLLIYYMIKKYRLAALRERHRSFAGDLVEKFIYNKTNRRGGKIQRTILVGEKFLYNLELFSTEPLWASYLESIKWIKLNKKQPSVKIGYNESLEKKMAKDSKIEFYPKSEREFVFTSEEQKRLFVFHIRKNIYQYFDRIVKVSY